MAERYPLHKPLDLRSGLETGGQAYDPPLLPYEIALIEALGCTEEEYRQFVRHAQLQARVRPAEYAHIPDIVNDPVSIFVSLVIGLAFSAASVLLAPKAPALETPAKIKGKKLADQIGPTRFNQTTSFDNVSSLAEYGQPIPIPFGKRGTGTDGELTGGLILAPALVWSRLYSYGAFQAYEGLYVAGQYGLEAPGMGGVRLGTFALDTLGDREFALFWSSSLSANFPTALIGGDAKYGTSGRQVFTAPSASREFDRSNSMAYNPSAQYQFGTASPIHNGTAYRFNWEIISAPFSSTKGEDNEEVRYEIRAKRRKIAGADADILHDDAKPGVGMPGVGRAYSRRMGFIAVQRQGSSSFQEFRNRTIVEIGVGDLAVFEIYEEGWRQFQKEDFQYNGKRVRSVNLKDLSNTARSWRERAVDLLVIGSRWIIGASIWVVENKADVAEKTKHIYFRCVSVVGVPTLGIAGYRTVREPLGGYNGLEYNDEKHCGAAFFNVCRLYMSNIRPVRRDAVAIEFGIRSQVWNKASGLCNFNALPTPADLFNFDEKDITLTTPKMDKYFDRASCFSVMVRPVSKYGEAELDWVRIPELFCVIGRAPIDQYNYLRIKPRIQGYYEYRFIPRTGTDIAQNSIDTNTAIRLFSEGGEPYGRDYETPYGTFRITTTGKEIAVADIKANDEMFTAPNDEGTDPYPISSYTKQGPASVYQSDSSTSPAGGQYPLNAWLTSYLGRAWNDKNQGKTGSFEITMTKTNDSNKTLTLKVKATSVKSVVGQTVGAGYKNLTGSTYKWTNLSYQVIDYTGTWNVGDTIKDARSVSNIFFSGTVNIQFACSAVTTSFKPARKISRAERVFELNSQVADCSHFQELQKSNENGPEHEIVYINEFTENDEAPTYYGMSTVGLAIKSSGQINSVDQLRLWTPTGIAVTRLIEGDNAPSNLFADLVYYLLSSKSQGVGNIVPSELIDVDSLRIAASFQQANGIFYDGVLEESESLRSFLYDNAALQLCNFTIKNGRFGMMPALPYTSGYKISTSPIVVEQLFTAGNIIADSLQVQYIDAAQRSNFRALVSWRVTVENDLPTQASALVDWADIPEGSRATTQQAFDLTDFCTNRAQALLTARFLLSIRRRVTHTVSFKTVPDSLGIEPGSYIQVATTSTTYSIDGNGIILGNGSISTVTPIPAGTYQALVYDPSTGETKERSILVWADALFSKTGFTIRPPWADAYENPATRPNIIAALESGVLIGDITYAELYGTLFTLKTQTTKKTIYQVEQLTLDEDGLVNVSAVEVPVDSNGASIVAQDVLNEAAFRVLE